MVRMNHRRQKCGQWKTFFLFMRVYGMYIQTISELPRQFSVYSMYLTRKWVGLTTHIPFTNIQIVDAGGSVKTHTHTFPQNFPEF